MRPPKFGLLGGEVAGVVFPLGDEVGRADERLDEPFVTAGTVAGEKGIKQAQDEYQRLMNNKSPKSKRK